MNSQRKNLIKLILCSELIFGLIFAYKGIVSSSGQFLRLLTVIGVGTPGVLIIFSSIYALRTQGVTKINNIAVLNAVFIVPVCVLLTFGWHQRHSADSYYSKFYQSVKNGMTLSEVRNLAGGRQGQCAPAYDGTSNSICGWRDTYNQDGSKGCDCHSIDVIFDLSGEAISVKYDH